MSLSVNDYRAGERTFQLLTQAAGRAGRGKRPGEVVIQTYQPEHYSILHAAAQDYEGFYEEEILYRQLLSYPPVSHILAVQVTSLTEKGGEELAGILKALAEKTEEGREEHTILIGPAPAFIGRINDIFRYVLYIKNPDYDILIRLKNRMERFLKELERKDENVQFDFDPMSSF